MRLSRFTVQTVWTGFAFLFAVAPLEHAGASPGPKVKPDLKVTVRDVEAPPVSGISTAASRAAWRELDLVEVHLAHPSSPTVHKLLVTRTRSREIEQMIEGSDGLAPLGVEEAKVLASAFPTVRGGSILHDAVVRGVAKARAGTETAQSYHISYVKRQMKVRTEYGTDELSLAHRQLVPNTIAPPWERTVMEAGIYGGMSRRKLQTVYQQSDLEDMLLKLSPEEREKFVKELHEAKKRIFSAYERRAPVQVTEQVRGEYHRKWEELKKLADSKPKIAAESQGGASAVQSTGGARKIQLQVPIGGRPAR